MLDIANSATDAVVGTVNTVGLVWNWTAGFIPGVRLAGHIEAPDWSEGLRAYEDPQDRKISRIAGDVFVGVASLSGGGPSIALPKISVQVGLESVATSGGAFAPAVSLVTIGGAAIPALALVTLGATANMMSAGQGSSGDGDAPNNPPTRRVTHDKHHPNSASAEPPNVQQLFDQAIVDQKGVRWAKDPDGVIHRFSKPSNGDSHWNGSTAGNKPIRPEDIPNPIRKAFQ